MSKSSYMPFNKHKPKLLNIKVNYIRSKKNQSGLDEKN